MLFWLYRQLNKDSTQHSPAWHHYCSDCTMPMVQLLTALCQHHNFTYQKTVAASVNHSNFMKHIAPAMFCHSFTAIRINSRCHVWLLATADAALCYYNSILCVTIIAKESSTQSSLIALGAAAPLEGPVQKFALDLTRAFSCEAASSLLPVAFYHQHQGS